MLISFGVGGEPKNCWLEDDFCFERVDEVMGMRVLEERSGNGERQGGRERGGEREREWEGGSGTNGRSKKQQVPSVTTNGGPWWWWRWWGWGRGGV